MRHLTSITLAIALLMALACTAAPAAPTPNIDATVEARVKEEVEVKPTTEPTTLAATARPNLDATIEAMVLAAIKAQPTATPYPTYTPIPTVTPASKPTDTPPRAAAPTPTLVAAPTAMPTLTPAPTTMPTQTPYPTTMPTQTPYPTVTPTPVPATTSYVIAIEGEYLDEEVTFKINNTGTSQTIQARMNPGHVPVITKLHLSIEDEHQGINDFEQITGGIDGSNGQVGAVQIIIGTASINGQPAPVGTVVTAWQNGGKDLVGATTVINEPDEYTGNLGTTLGPLGENLINVLGFDNKEKQWTFYDPRQSFIHLSSIRTLNNEAAYYISVAEDQDVTLNGISSRLYQGLNIIPWGSYRGVDRLPISPDDGLSSYLGENLVRVWRFENSTQSWSFFDPRPMFADANTLRILNNDDVIQVRVSEDVDTTVNGTSLELFGFSNRTTSEYPYNLIIWHHGPTSSTQTPRPTPTKKPPTPTPSPTATPKPSRATSFSDGTWVVGADILHGTYRSSRTGAGCYWERLSGFSGGTGDIIANEYTDELSLVEISSTDAGFSTEDCGTWKKATTRITSSLTSAFGNGTFIVGLDIASGTWRSPGGDSCYWERLSGFSGESKHIEANDYGASNNIVTIQSTDKGFLSGDCGSWTKQ